MEPKVTANGGPSWRKLTSQEVYLLSLRQILLNQAAMLKIATGQITADEQDACIETSHKLARRIEDFLSNSE